MRLHVGRRESGQRLHAGRQPGDRGPVRAAFRIVRLTYQATPKNKLSAFLDRPFKYKGREFTFGIEPSRASRRRNLARRTTTTPASKLTSTISNRLLYELGFTADRRAPAHRLSASRSSRPPRGGTAPDGVRTCLRDALCLRRRSCDVRPARGSGTSRTSTSSPSERTVATTGYAGTLPDRNHVTTALSYVTGSHNFKGGFQWSFGQDRNDASSHGDINDAAVSQRRAGIGRRHHQPVRHRGVRQGRHGHLHSGHVEVQTADAQPRRPLRVLQLDDQGAVASRRAASCTGRSSPRSRACRSGRTSSPRLRRGLRPVRRRPDGAQVRRQQVHAADGGKLRQTLQPDPRPAPPTRATGSTSICFRARRPAPASPDRPTATTSSRTTRSARATTRTSARRRRGSAVDGIKRESNVEYTASVQRQLFDRLSVTAGVVSPPVPPPDRGRQRRCSNRQRLHAVPGRQPARQRRNHHDLQPQPGQARAGGDPRSTTPTRTRTSPTTSSSASTAGCPNGSTLFGGWTASRNVAVTCDQDNPNGSADERPLFRHLLPARAAVLRRAEAGHPVPPRLQVGRHAAAALRARVQRHVRELRRQRNPGRLERAGLGVPQRSADAARRSCG